MVDPETPDSRLEQCHHPAQGHHRGEGQAAEAGDRGVAAEAPRLLRGAGYG